MFFYLCTFNKKIRQECTHVLWDFFVKKIDLIDGSTHATRWELLSAWTKIISTFGIFIMR